MRNLRISNQLLLNSLKDFNNWLAIKATIIQGGTTIITTIMEEITNAKHVPATTVVGLGICHVTAGHDATTIMEMVITTLGIGGHHQTTTIIGANPISITIIQGNILSVTNLDTLLHNAHKGTPTT